MFNIPFENHSTQDILRFHKELELIFSRAKLASTKDKFLTGMATQNTFLTETREDLIPVLSDIEQDECLIVELWVQDALIFDADYYKVKISSISTFPLNDRDFDQLICALIADIKNVCTNLIPILFCFCEDKRKQSTHLPFGIDLIEKPFTWSEKQKTQKRPKPSKPKEKDLEKELLDWLFSYGIQADNQVKTSKHRTDIWIPSKCFLELKRDKITGDDVCQAIDYCAEHKMPIVIVGNSITDMACRGISAFNKAVNADLICFVQWSAIKVYLKGMLNLR